MPGERVSASNAKFCEIHAVLRSKRRKREWARQSRQSNLANPASSVVIVSREEGLGWVGIPQASRIVPERDDAQEAAESQEG